MIMSSAKLTLIGLNQYMAAKNDNLFKLMLLPDGIEKETLIDVILMRGGEFEVYYANPEFIQSAIGIWSKKNLRTFEKWVAALSIEYNPLENYDRIEDYTDTSEGTTSNDSTSNSSDMVSAYNSDMMRNNNSNTSNISADGSFKNETVHTARLHGNIGVTTSQQMLEAELDIAKWNLYDNIAELFLNEFVIPLY